MKWGNGEGRGFRSNAELNRLVIGGRFPWGRHLSSLKKKEVNLGELKSKSTWKPFFKKGGGERVKRPAVD